MIYLTYHERMDVADGTLFEGTLKLLDEYHEDMKQRRDWTGPRPRWFQPKRGEVETWCEEQGIPYTRHSFEWQPRITHICVEPEDPTQRFFVKMRWY